MELTEAKVNCIDVLLPIEKLLRISGVWPVKEFKIDYLLRTAVSWIISYVLLGMMFAEVIHVLGDVRKINEVACALTPTTVYCFKMTALVYYRKRFFNILEILNSDLFNSYDDTMRKPLQKIIKITNKAKKIFQMLTMCVLTFYTIFPIFDEKDLPIPFSFDVKGYKHVIHVFQISALSLCAWNLTSIDLLFVCLMGIAAAIIDTLRRNIANVVSDAEKLNNESFRNSRSSIRLNRSISNLLRRCIMLHMTILRYIDDVETIFSLSLLVHYLTAIMLICSSLLQLTTLVDIHSIQFLLSCTFVIIVVVQSFLYHWFGNEVIVKSTRIGEACYASEWYKCSVEARKMLLMLMIGSQKPLGITIHKFAMLSLASFLTIIRWSYSFATLIRTRYISE